MFFRNEFEFNLLKEFLMRSQCDYFKDQCDRIFGHKP